MKPLVTPGGRRSLLPAALAALVLLLATADDRTVGLIGDGQQMLRTAVSIAENGELGIAHTPNNTVHRAAGDDVSRYGMGFSLLLVVPVLLAERFDSAFGAGASQSLFTAIQCVLVLAAGVFCARLSRSLGADAKGQKLALFGLIFSTPLWAYASGDFSEALQAAAIAAAAALSFDDSESQPLKEAGRCLGAGFAAGAAILTKSFLLPGALLLLAPLLIRRERRARRVLAAAGGLAAPCVVWAVLEKLRFGKILGGYPGEAFSHSFLDGLWRLSVGWNKGLLLYAPLTVLAIPYLMRSLRTAHGFDAIRRVFLLMASLALFLPICKWWAWDGVTGWGPRLLVPLLPLLIAAAAADRERYPRALFGSLLCAGVAINSLGVFQTAQTLSAYSTDVPPIVVAPGRAPKGPGMEKMADGRYRVPAYVATTDTARLSPLRIHLFFLRARLAGGNVKARLSNPPWKNSHPEFVPHFLPISDGEPVYRSMFDGFRWPFCGDAIFGRRPRRDLPHAYLDALQDQVSRAFDLDFAVRALSEARRLQRNLREPMAFAYFADALRLNERFDEERSYLQSLPEEEFETPPVAVATALLAVSEGRMEDARGAIRNYVVPEIPRATALLDAEPEAWPATVRAFFLSD